MYALADCNNFFVSCERVFRPDLNGKPVIVLSSNDGCAIARSNEAKAIGIKMGDPLFKIRDIIKAYHVTVFSGNMALYGDMSQRVRIILQEFTPSVEVYSIDEAFLDLRGLPVSDYDAFAKEVSHRCLQCTSIPVSVGVAPTKTLAKIASKLCKQYPKLRGGCYMYRRQDIDKVLSRFPVSDVWGIGRRSTRKLQERNIVTAYDFMSMEQATVNGLFGVTALRTWRELRGEACIEFEDTIQDKQSICVSRSFSSEITDCEELCEQIANFAAMAVEKLRAQHSVCVEMSVFAFTNRFKENDVQSYNTLLVSFPVPTDNCRSIVASAVSATRELFRKGIKYKKAGVVMSRVMPARDVQHSLFEDKEALNRENVLSDVMDAINGNFGRGAIKIGTQGSGMIKNNSNNQSPHYTTRWSDLPSVTVK